MRSCKQVPCARPSPKGWTAALLFTSIAIVGLSKTPIASAYSLSMTSYYLKCISSVLGRPWYINDVQGLDWGGCGAHLYVPVQKLVIARCYN